METSVHLRRGSGGAERQQERRFEPPLPTESGAPVFLLLKNPSSPRAGWRTLCLLLCRLPDESLFRWSVRFGPVGVRKVSAGAMRGARLAASTLECQFKFWNDISPPKKKKWNPVGRSRTARNPRPFSPSRAQTRGGSGGKRHTEFKLLMTMSLWTVVNSSVWKFHLMLDSNLTLCKNVK